MHFTFSGEQFRAAPSAPAGLRGRLQRRQPLLPGRARGRRARGAALGAHAAASGAGHARARLPGRLPRRHRQGLADARPQRPRGPQTRHCSQGVHAHARLQVPQSHRPVPGQSLFAFSYCTGSWAGMKSAIPMQSIMHKKTCVMCMCIV